MIIIDHAQGSPEWLAHRRTTHNASDAPVMMGVSPYVTRSDLIKQRATGVEREIDAATQYIFDKGHAVEPLLRALAESIIGEDLYPVTATSDDGYLSASFDGVTLGEYIIFEAKQHNADKRACIYRGEIPPADYFQIVQQFAVCTSATQCLYLCGDGTETNTAQLWIDRAQIEPDIPKLIAGWAQFASDVAAYQPEPEAAPIATGRTPDQLPALRIEVTGMVTASNLAEWKEAAISVFHGISTDLHTDQDFADAEKTVKWCGDIEDQLKAAKQHALSQTASIDELFRTIDAIGAEARAKRLDLDKLVKARKESIKGEIIAGGSAGVRAHYDAINATLGQHAFQPAQSLTLDLGAAIKGKRTISSMRDAVDAAAASEKIAASQRAERVRACIAVLDQHGDHRHLFADAVQLCATKQPDDLQNLAASRIAEHQQREAARLEAERERIRKEEQERADREAADRERERLHQESAERAERERAEAIVATPAPAAHAVQQAANTPVHVPQSTTGTRIKLGDINARIAPLSITAEGLAQLGFQPAGIERSAKLYNLADLPMMCEHMRRCLARAASLKEAA